MLTAAISMHGPHCRRAVFALVLGALSLSAPAAEVLIEPRIGFQGLFQLGQPFALEVNLSNIGPAIDGVLEVEVWKRSAAPTGAYPVRYRQKVFLSARANRKLGFTVDPDILSRPLTIRYRSDTASASRDVDLRGHFTPAPLILTISERGTLPLASFAASFANRVVAIAAASLPADARGLAGVSHLVLYDRSLRDLGQVQLQALDDWLAAGGRLVIIGSVNFALYQEPKLARFLPARVTGVTRIDFTEPSAAGGGTVEGVWAQTVTDVIGRTVTASQGLPLLVENGWGRGRVTYLALDAGRPPFSTWPGLPRFLQGLLAPPTEHGVLPRPRWDEALFARLLSSSWFIASYIPTRALFFAILLYLAGLAVLLRLWRRRRDDHRVLALWCGGWAVCATVAGLFYFSRGGNTPEGVLLAASVMDDIDNGYVDTQTNLALFSTQRHQYSLGFGPNWLELTPLAGTGAEPRPAPEYQRAGGAARVQLPLDRWGYQLLRARHVERAGLRAAIEIRDGALALDVRNHSGYDLEDCWLVAPGMRIALGDVPSGGGLSKSFPVNAPAAGDSAQSTAAIHGGSLLQAVRFGEAARELLFHDAFFAQESTHPSRPGRVAVFFGWIRNPRPRAEVGDKRVRVEQYSLYRAMVSLPLQEDE